MDIHACMPARTHSSTSLLALQAVSHPSIHVTERWVHPMTGQLVAVTLIYVAPLSSLFLLWWRDYVCSLPIRMVYSACNGGLVRELSQTGVGRRAPAWENCMMASCLGSIILYNCFCLSHLNLDTWGLFRRHVVPFICVVRQSQRPQSWNTSALNGEIESLWMGH